MRYRSVSLLLFFIFVFSWGNSTQAQQLYIDLRLFDSQARVFNVGDLDPTGFGNAPNYYTLEIGNRGAVDEGVRILFSVISNGVVFVEGQSNVFQLPPGVFIFPSSQLNTGTAFINSQEIKIGKYQIDFASIQDLEKKVIKTGKLPAGVYEFRVELLRDPPVGAPIPDLNPGDNILTITNPTTIEPLYPGLRVNSLEVPEIPTTTPYFVWQSDAEFFNLYVYRKYEADDIQDVLSRDPILFLESYPGQIFQFPSESEPLIFFNSIGDPIGRSIGAVRLIEPGNIYYWFVEALIPTASGVAQLPSDVFQFKVSDREKSAMDSDLILAYLRQILGERFDESMEPLKGFSPSGAILLNGAPANVQVLEELVSQFVSGKAVLQEVFVQE